MKVNEKIRPYKTKSVEVVAFLMFKGHKIMGKTEEERYKNAVFVDSKSLQDDVCEFYNGADAKRLFD